MEERRRKVAVEEDGERNALDKPRGGVGGDEDRVEDGGEVDRVERGGEGGDDYGAGLGELAGLLRERAGERLEVYLRTRWGGQRTRA